ncbi:hypothetical protein D3G38_26550 [Escherichia coli]|nr:hypothetical protein [Escherichia coli]
MTESAIKLKQTFTAEDMDEEWNSARQWLWKHRENVLPNADIWDDINSLKYRLSPIVVDHMQVYRRISGEKLVQWCSRDVLALKLAASHAIYAYAL